MDFKQSLLGSSLGRLALEVRNKTTLLRVCFDAPEILGMIANDQMATRLVLALCPKGGAFVDVGAHIGSVVAAMLHRNPAAHIIAIEAVEKKATGLRRTFPQIEVHACALGESEGRAPFFIDLSHTANSSLDRNPAGATVQEVQVRVATLDAILDGRRIDALKIDVEGAELGVLLGGETTIAESRPVVMFESGPRKLNGLAYTKEALWRYFNERDYALLTPNRVAHLDDGLSLEGFLESHLYPRRTTNYFALPRERRLDLREAARSELGMTPG